MTWLTRLAFALLLGATSHALVFAADEAQDPSAPTTKKAATKQAPPKTKVATPTTAAPKTTAPKTTKPATKPAAKPIKPAPKTSGSATKAKPSGKKPAAAAKGPTATKEMLHGTWQFAGTLDEAAYKKSPEFKKLTAEDQEAEFGLARITSERKAKLTLNSDGTATLEDESAALTRSESGLWHTADPSDSSITLVLKSDREGSPEIKYNLTFADNDTATAECPQVTDQLKVKTGLSFMLTKAK